MARSSFNPVLREKSAYRADDEEQPDLLEATPPPKPKEGQEPSPFHISREEITRRAEETRLLTQERLSNQNPALRRRKGVRKTNNGPTDEELKALEEE